MQYRPYSELGGSPHVMADGPPRRGMCLNLSHWPGNRTPAALKRDTSTETVFAYLDQRRAYPDARFASNNHFDEDGLFSLFGLCHPRLALKYRDLLCDAARTGDFGVYRRRAAAHLCAVIEAHADPALSPFPREIFRGPYARFVAAFYRQCLTWLPFALSAPRAHRRYWREADAALEAGETALAAGRVILEEDPALDLAIVRIPPEFPLRTFHRYLRREQAPVHPFVINRVTPASRLVLIHGRRLSFQYRYESWVELAGRRPAARRDLEPFRRWLNQRETGCGRWCFEDPTRAEVARLYLGGGGLSTIDPERFIRELKARLRTAPVAWDAFAPPAA